MKAIYAGSFDPPTLGHDWMIEEARGMFGSLIVAVGINAAKKTMFTVEERIKMLKDMYGDKVIVDSFEGEFLIHYAIRKQAYYLVRGIRSVTDFEYEQGMRHINNDINSEITTVFLMPPRNLSEVSSSLVKGLIGPTGWRDVIKRYVPDIVYQKFIDRFGNETH